MDLSRMVEVLSGTGAISARAVKSLSGRDLLLVRAMIAAGMADGHVDGNQKARILRSISELGLRDPEKHVILEELRQPLSLEGLANATFALEQRDRALRMEVYAASLRAIDSSCAAGRRYLEDLAEILALPPTVVRSLEEWSLPGVGADRAA